MRCAGLVLKPNPQIGLRSRPWPTGRKTGGCVVRLRLRPVFGGVPHWVFCALPQVSVWLCEYAPALLGVLSWSEVKESFGDGVGLEVLNLPPVKMNKTERIVCFLRLM